MENVIQPILRFPEFEGNWEVTKFGNHYSFKNTNSLSREKLNYENGVVKNIHYGDIHTIFSLLFDVTKENVPFINPDEDISNISEENYVQNGDIIIADASEDYADIGKSIEVINTNDELIVAGLHTFLARKEDKNVASGFFAFLLNTYKARLEIMRIAQGTKVLGLSKDRFSEISLYIPCSNEQQKIANFLKSLNNRIELLNLKKEILEDYKKVNIQKLFSQELRFKKDNGDDFPNWEVTRIDKIFAGLKGTGLSKEKIEEEGINECILYGELYTKYSEVIREIKSKTNVKEGTLSVKGDLLIPASTTTTGIDLASVTSLNKEKVLLGGDINILRKKVNLNSNFYAYYLTNYKKHQIAKYAQGITIVHLYYKDIKMLNVDFPSVEEQDKIASFLLKIDDKIELLSKQIEQTIFYKKSLLQKMFI